MGFARREGLTWHLDLEGVDVSNVAVGATHLFYRVVTQGRR